MSHLALCAIQRNALGKMSLLFYKYVFVIICYLALCAIQRNNMGKISLHALKFRVTKFRHFWGPGVGA